MSKTSLYLKSIKGVLVIHDEGEPRLCCLADMQNTKHFGVGQIFNAIAELNGKTSKNYGKLWPKFRDSNGDVSKEWKTLEVALENCNNDYEFVIEACKQLQEEVPECIPRSEVQKRLDQFNANSEQFVKENI